MMEILAEMFDGFAHVAGIFFACVSVFFILRRLNEQDERLTRLERKTIWK